MSDTLRDHGSEADEAISDLRIQLRDRWLLPPTRECLLLGIIELAQAQQKVLVKGRNRPFFVEILSEAAIHLHSARRRPVRFDLEKALLESGQIGVAPSRAAFDALRHAVAAVGDLDDGLWPEPNIDKALACCYYAVGAPRLLREIQYRLDEKRRAFIK